MTTPSTSRFLVVFLVAGTFVLVAGVAWVAGALAGRAMHAVREGAGAGPAPSPQPAPSTAAAPQPMAAPMPQPPPVAQPVGEAEIRKAYEEARARMERTLSDAQREITSAQEILRVGGAVRPPVKVSGPAAPYTELARKAGIQGVVLVEATIDRTGVVIDTRVLKGLPMGLDASARDAVRQWRFEPATRNGQPVPVYFTVVVDFRLR